MIDNTVLGMYRSKVYENTNGYHCTLFQSMLNSNSINTFYHLHPMHESPLRDIFLTTTWKVVSLPLYSYCHYIQFHSIPGTFLVLKLSFYFYCFALDHPNDKKFHKNKSKVNTFLLQHPHHLEQSLIHFIYSMNICLMTPLNI